MPSMPATRRRIALASALLAVFVLAALALAAPVLAQEYTTPTAPEYQPPPDSGPDDDTGEAPDDTAPDDDAAPDTGAGAPGDDTRTLPAGTLPVTGSDEVAFLTALGFVMLLGGFAVRRGFRPAG